MAKRGNRVQVILECTEHKNSGQPGTSRYITTKNRKNTPDRMELKKYNSILKKAIKQRSDTKRDMSIILNTLFLLQFIYCCFYFIFFFNNFRIIFINNFNLRI